MNNGTSLKKLYTKLDNLPKIEYINNDVLTIIFSFLPWQEFSQIKEYYKMYYLSYKTYFKTNTIPYINNICLEDFEYNSLISYLINNENMACEVSSRAKIYKNIINFETEIIVSMYFCLFSGYLKNFKILNNKYELLNFVEEHETKDGEKICKNSLLFFIDYKKINNYFDNGSFFSLRNKFEQNDLLTIMYIIKSTNYLEFIKYFVKELNIKITETFKKIIYSKMNISEFEFIYENNIYRFKENEKIKNNNIMDYLAIHNKKTHFDFLYNLKSKNAIYRKMVSIENKSIYSPMFFNIS